MSPGTVTPESSCARVEPLLLRLPDGDLSPGEEADLERHLAFCSSCRAGAKGLAELGEQLRSAAPSHEGLPSGAAFAARLAATEERPRSGFLRIPPLYRWSLAGALAASLAALYWPSASTPRPAVAPSAALQPQSEPAPMLFVVDDEEAGRRVVLAATGSGPAREP